MDFEFEIKKLKLEKDDLLIIKCNQYLTQDQAIRMKAQTEKILEQEIKEKKIKIFVLERGLDIFKKKTNDVEQEDPTPEGWEDITSDDRDKAMGDLSKLNARLRKIEISKL